MSTDITIRAATAADAGTLVDLRERMLCELGRDDAERLGRLREGTLEWFAEGFSAGEVFGWIAERDGCPVGGVTMAIIRTQPQYRCMDGRVASIFGLFVEPVERGAGIATRLVETAVAQAGSLGLELVSLHAAEKARPIYERLGFEASSEMRRFL